MRAASKAARKPDSRAVAAIMSSGPVMIAISRWPSSIRCRVAAYAPLQSAEPIDGTSGAGCPAGSSMTNGILRALSCRLLRVQKIAGDEDDPDRAAIEDPLDPVQIRPLAVVRPRDNQAHPVLASQPFNRRDRLGGPGAGDLETQHLDQRGRIRASAAPVVLVLLKEGFDPSTGVLRDSAAAVEHLGDR